MKPIVGERCPAFMCHNFTLILAIVLSAVGTLFGAGKPFTHRMVYHQGGLDNRSNGIDSLIARMRSGKRLGYNAMVAIDSKLEILESMPKDYLDNVKRAVAEAEKLEMALIPAHFHQGQHIYGKGNDHARVEAFPVKNTKFVVSSGEARGVGDHPTGFKNGNFESYNGNTPLNWSLSNLQANRSCFIDKAFKKEGSASLRMVNQTTGAHIRQNIDLKPFRAYRISAFIATQDIKGQEYRRLMFSVKGHTTADGHQNELLGRRSRPFGTSTIWSFVSRTQGWREVHVDFNSLYSTAATLCFWSNCSKVPSGTVWIDDIRLEEVGLYETVRRKSQENSIVVRSADGNTTYREGTDYIVDPKCNTFTDDSYFYEGHLKIPQESPIKNGQELRVNWYQYADVETAVPETDFCLRETWNALRDNLTRIDNIMGHKNWMWMAMNEWRVAGWNDQCKLMKFQTAGEYMGKSLRMIQNLLWEENGCRQVYTWNDMFDPYHNAWKPYRMTNGGALNSWKDLHDSTIIINWRPGPHWDKMSYRFYMGLDDSLNPEGKVIRQIIPCNTGGIISSRLKTIEQFEKEGGKGVIGIVYLCWSSNHSQMAAVANVCKSYGRWGDSPFPRKACKPAHMDQKEPAPLPTAPSRMSVARADKKTIVHFGLKTPGKVKLSVVDLHGRRIQILAQKRMLAGNHKATWNTSSLPAGMYFLRLNVEGAGQQSLKQIVF